MEAIVGYAFAAAPVIVAVGLIFMGILLMSRTIYRYATAPAR